MINTLFFDLDGTLLHMDQDLFIKGKIRNKTNLPGTVRFTGRSRCLFDWYGWTPYMAKGNQSCH